MTKTVMDELWDAFPRMEPDEVRSVLALFLFTVDDVFQKIETLSGGQLAEILCRQAAQLGIRPVTDTVTEVLAGNPFRVVGKAT